MPDLSSEDAKAAEQLETVWVERLENVQCRVDVGHRFAFITDEPVQIGGSGMAVNPFAMLLTALGTCCVGSMTGYARTHGIPLDDVHIKLSRKINITSSTGPGDDREQQLRIVRINRDITVSGPETEEQLEELGYAAYNCPVANSIKDAVDIRDTIKVADR